MSKLIWMSLITCGGLGKIPFASGTWGSLGALIFWAFLMPQVSVAVAIVLLILNFGIGILSIRKARVYLDRWDHSYIVIDEWLGMGIAVLASDFGYMQLGLAFVLFRIFDIMKPPGALYFDRNDMQGFGVMLDDVVAGFYAAALLGTYNVFFAG